MSFRTHLSALIAMVALAGGLAQPAQAQGYTPQVYFSPHEEMAEETAKIIDAAQDTLDIAMYSISTSGTIWDSLEQAVNRGVTVRMILHNATRSSGRAKVQALEGIGVHVFGVSATMHEKFAIADARRRTRRLVNGSANWSRGAQFRYSENTVIYGRHYHLVHAFQEEFNRLLDASRPISADAADHDEPIHLRTPSSRVRRFEKAFFTSMNDGDRTWIVADEIIRLMNEATESIKIDVAHFNSERIAQALIKVHEDNPSIEIEVLLDLGEYGDGRSRSRDLESAGITVRYKTFSLAFHHPRSQLMHHKTIIIDGGRLIGTGSYNWSDTAEHGNYENFLTIEGDVRRNRAFADRFVDEHDSLWDSGRDVYPAFREAITARPGDPDYRRIIPVHFDTPYFNHVMTLTRREIRPLRTAANRAGLITRDGGFSYNKAASYLDRENPGPFDDTLPDATLIDETAVGGSSSRGLSGSVNPTRNP
jgi:phosphatidylserine/phosphatidylglycerophosphate/cardiolipin synthase-like enzyme